MKKIFTAFVMSVSVIWTSAQTKFYVFMKDGSEVEFNISDVDSIGFSKKNLVVDSVTPEKNVHDFVDLGLPSGNLWATCNIGAKTHSEWGEYFAWGETATKSEYVAANCATYGRTIEQLNYLGYTNKGGNLTVEYDAAYQNWGDNWRMPTRVDFQELINECKWTWTTVGNVYGYEVKSKAPGNNNSIFLPAAGSKDDYDIKNRGVTGWYWTSTGHSIEYYLSWNLVFDKEEGCQMTVLSRRTGFSIRPIYVKP